MNKIDWNELLRMVGGAGPMAELVQVSVFDKPDDYNKIIKYYRIDGNGPFYTVVSEETGISFEPDGYNVDNVPEEPANCVALIKYSDECRDVSARGKWFVSPVQEDAEGDITPMRRSELELSVDGLDPYVIVELPS